MPDIHVGDETFVAADPTLVAAVVADAARWPQWWPDLQLSLLRDRGVKGCQWGLTGAVGGTAELYLEPWHDGTVVHLFLRLDLPEGTDTLREQRERQLAWKRTVVALKDELEGDRRPGTPGRGPQVPAEI